MWWTLSLTYIMTTEKSSGNDCKCERILDWTASNEEKISKLSWFEGRDILVNLKRYFDVRPMRLSSAINNQDIERIQRLPAIVNCLYRPILMRGGFGA